MKNLTQKFIGLLVLVFTVSFNITAQSVISLPTPEYPLSLQPGCLSHFDYEPEGSVYISITDENGIRLNENPGNGASLLHTLKDGFLNESMSAFEISPGTYNYYVQALSYGICVSSPPHWAILLGEDTIVSGEAISALEGSFVVEGHEIFGCTDATAFNYDVDANTDNGSCVALVDGCTNANAFNYNANANTDDNSCVAVVNGCTDSSAYNYYANANTDDGSCNTLSLPKGWSMFGYTCLDSIDAATGFSEIADQIEVVKDEWGLPYFPSWDFNALGALHYSEGYQIRMKEAITNFQFCEAITPEDGISEADLDSVQALLDAVVPEDGISQVDVDAGVAAVHAMYEGWCASDIDNDGICDVDEVSGCMDASSCNFVSEAEFDDGSCDYSCLDECGVINGDNSTCIDCAGVVNGTSEDLGCGCVNPAAQEGYDCDGNFSPEIGDLIEGGMVFKINENGTGLVADLQDLPYSNWDNAKLAALNSTSGGYDDWYLPSPQELMWMYSTLGNGGGLETSDRPVWSSAEYDTYLAYVVSQDGSSHLNFKFSTYRVRAIRAF